MKRVYILFTLLITLLALSCKKTDKAQRPATGSENLDPIVSTSGKFKLINLKINGAPCAYDAPDNIYYFPVSLDKTLSNYTVEYNDKAADTLYFNNLRIKNGEAISYPLTTNQTIPIRVVSNADTIAISYKLITTGLPMVIINMKQPGEIDSVVKKDATMDIVDPDYVTHKTNLETHSDINIAMRGASAKRMLKKAYKINTLDANDNAMDVPILGLRSDEDWILDAMYVDPARMRNRVCTDLWNSFNNVPYIDREPDALNGTRGYMTEVFLDGKYAGLYCLTEKLDRKQLKVSKKYGAVYKSTWLTKQTTFFDNAINSDASATWAGWEFSYPDIDDMPAPTWGYLSGITKFIAYSSDGDFTANIANRVDINNLVDYFIFMNAIYASDNMGKNQFFSFYDSRINAKFFYSPWDMDGTLGRDWGGSYLPNAILGTGSNNLFVRLLSLDAGHFKELVKARWATLKNNQLSKAAVDSRIEYYRNLLVSTNAFSREDHLTYNIYQTLNDETQYMVHWYSTQYDMVDRYFNTF